MREGDAVEPAVVLQKPNFSLYCLDFEKRQALFVETPPECDLSRAPFFYQAQYEAALRLVQVPFPALHRLAAEIVLDPSRLILIYSVGRCGSTLVSRAFGEVEGVESISEPDVFTQMLGEWGGNDLQGAEKAALVRSCTLLQCAPSRFTHATAWAIKFRSMVTEMGHLFYALFPEAKVVFLYRNAEPWARSFQRVVQAADPAAQGPVAEGQDLFGRGLPSFGSRETISALELMAAMWRSVMETCLAMQQRGVPMFVARYEELNAAPREVLAQMFSHCGLAANAIGTLDAVLEQDSQAGSALSRENLAQAAASLSPAHLEELRRLIRDGSQTLTADTILPGTYFPPGDSRKAGP